MVDTPKIAFLTSTVLTGLSVILIFGFLFLTAAPVLIKEGFGFFLGTVWDYKTNTYGIFHLIIGTLLLTAMTIAMAFPLSVFTAIFLAEWAPAWLEKIMRPPIEMLIGIPSVVYGLVGFYFLEPIFRNTIEPAIGGTLGQVIPLFRDSNPLDGFGYLLSATVLTIMILPTVAVLSQEAMKNVPLEYREGSLAVGATKWQTIKKIVLPAAYSGIITAFILGIMRAVGETMAVLMLMGGSIHMPRSFLDTGTVMTTKIIADIGYYISFDEPRQALFALGACIFIIEIIFVALTRAVTSRYKNWG